MKKAFIAAGLVVVLSSCAPTNSPVEKTSSTSVPSEKSKSLEEEFADAKADMESPSAEDLSVGKVGETWKYESGLEVTVTKLKRVKLTKYNLVQSPGFEGVIISVTIKNGTAEAFDSTLALMDVQYGVEGEQSEQVFDSANNENANGFNANIRPGKKASAKYEFLVPKSKKTEVEISFTPDFNSDPAQFTGRV